MKDYVRWFNRQKVNRIIWFVVDLARLWSVVVIYLLRKKHGFVGITFNFKFIEKLEKINP